MQFGRVDQASTWVGSGHFYHLIGRYLKLFHQSEVVYFQIVSATSIFDKSRLCLKFNLNQKFAERILLILSKSSTESQTGWLPILKLSGFILLLQTGLRLDSAGFYISNQIYAFALKWSWACNIFYCTHLNSDWFQFLKSTLDSWWLSPALGHKRQRYSSKNQTLLPQFWEGHRFWALSNLSRKFASCRVSFFQCLVRTEDRALGHVDD